MARFFDGYAEPTLDGLEDFHVVALNFSATWCGPCKRQDPLFERVASTFMDENPEARIAFLHVDVDENGALASRRRVKSVPTTLILSRESGLIWGQVWREKARFTGVVPFPKLMSEVEENVAEASQT